MTLREILARRATLAVELRALDPAADATPARMAEIETELAGMTTRQRQLALIDEVDRTGPAAPVETPAGETAYALTREQRMADWHKGTTGNDTAGLSAGRYIAGMLTGKWKGAEAEQRVMASNSSTTGGFMIPDPISANIIDLIRSNSGLIQAGALTIPMIGPNLTVVKIVTDPTSAFRGEGQAITESDGSFAALNLRAYSVAALVRINNELLDDVPAFGATLDGMIAGSMALKMDNAALYGTGAGQPQGLRTYTGMAEESMGANGAALTDYDPFLTLMQTVQEANGNPDTVIFAPRTSIKLAKLKTGIASDLTKLTPPAAFAAWRKIVSNQVSKVETQGSSSVASTAFIGGFSNVAFAIRQGITIEATRVADDTFAKNQTLVRAVGRFDIAVLRPDQLGRLIGIL